MTQAFALTFLIVFREGLEALLIVGALAACVIKTGALHRVPALIWGSVLALGASFAMAWALSDVFANIAGLTDAIVMILAAALLFYVSAWLWRFRNLRVWQDHLERRVNSATRGDSPFVLGGIAFLTVLREGTETIVFLYAYTADKDDVFTDVSLGIVAAFAVLGFCYILVQQLAVRFPLRPLLAVTSILFFILGLHFAGDVTDKLQAAGWLADHPVALPVWLIQFGIIPSLQVLAVQLTLIIGALALLWRTSKAARS